MVTPIYRLCIKLVGYSCVVGYYDNSSVQEEQTGWKLIADKYNIVVVWPNGLDDTIGKLFGTGL